MNFWAGVLKTKKIASIRYEARSAECARHHSFIDDKRALNRDYAKPVFQEKRLKSGLKANDYEKKDSANKKSLASVAGRAC